MIHDHRALGANVLIPTLAGDTPHAQATEAFRRAGAVTLTIGDFVRNPAGALSIPVTLRNEHNGHDFPTGATDISEAWIELDLTDAIKSERYEEAARFRDEINQVKQAFTPKDSA